MIYTVNEASKPVVENAVKHNNFASILFESEQNNMMIFEAALACDFHEIKGLREGTIVSSELATLQEKTFRDYLNTVGDMISKAIQKLIEVVRSVMKTVGQWLISKATPVADRFEQAYDKYTKDGKHFRTAFKYDWIDLDELSKKYPISEVHSKALDDLTKYESEYVHDSRNPVTSLSIASEIFNKYLGRGSGETTSSKFVNEAMEAAIEHKEIRNREDMQPLLDVLRKTDAIKSLKRAEQDLRQQLVDAKKLLNKNKDQTENKAELLSAVSAAYQNILNAFTSLHVKAVKHDIKQANTIVHKAIAFVEGGIKESVDYAIIVAESEFDSDMEIVPGQDEVDPKYDDAVNALIDASEPEASNE